MLGYHPHPPGADSPPKQTQPPRSRHPPPHSQEEALPQEQTPPPESGSGIQSMSGRYASYWNAYLFNMSFIQFYEMSSMLLPLCCLQSYSKYFVWMAKSHEISFQYPFHYIKRAVLKFRKRHLKVYWRCASLPGSNSFIFMQFWAKNCKIIG